jgi:GH15 family glucan-1,4-alpha-glucosidase
MAGNLEDYALIGDCATAALVDRDGSIDWLCWPRFDSAAYFAALVGSPDNGRWRLTAREPGVRMSRRYRDCTLILETEIESGGGAATIVDFMPPRGKTSDVVRLVYGRRGQVALRTDLVLRFDYGSLVPWVTRLDDGGWCAVSGPDSAVLRTPVPLHGDHRKITGEFTVSAGQTVPLVLTYGPSQLAPPGSIDPFEALSPPRPARDVPAAPAPRRRCWRLRY